MTVNFTIPRWAITTVATFLAFSLMPPFIAGVWEEAQLRADCALHVSNGEPVRYSAVKHTPEFAECMKGTLD